MDESFLAEVRKLAASGAGLDLQFGGVAARVATDRFCSLARPTHEEIGRFAAFMREAVVDADGAAAARMAEALLAHPACPESVLDLLIRRGRPAAALILSRAPHLSSTLLLERAERGDRAEAAAIASRPDLDSRIVASLARRTDPEPLRALAANQTVRIDHGAMLALVQRGRFDEALGRALLAREDMGFAALPLFLLADGPTRRALLVEAQSVALEHATVSPLQEARATAMAAAMAGNRPAFATAIALRLKTGRTLVDRLIDDSGGEPLALLFAALGANPALALDAIAMLHPARAPARPNIVLALESSAPAAWLTTCAIAHGQRSPAPARETSEGPAPLRTAVPAHRRNGAALPYSGLRKSLP